MTHRPQTRSVSHRRIATHILTRWRLLAERRLNYLNELSKSGRWRRYYTEAALAENISEAERAVSMWRVLDPLHDEPMQNSGAADIISARAPLPPLELAQAS